MSVKEITKGCPLCGKIHNIGMMRTEGNERYIVCRVRGVRVYLEAKNGRWFAVAVAPKK